MLCRKVKRELAAEKLKVQGLENDVSKLETKVSNKNHIINAYKDREKEAACGSVS